MPKQASFHYQSPTTPGRDPIKPYAAHDPEAGLLEPGDGDEEDYSEAAERFVPDTGAGDFNYTGREEDRPSAMALIVGALFGGGEYQPVALA